jgi:hypothetical protein
LLRPNVETHYQAKLFTNLKLAVQVVKIPHSSGAIGVVGADKGAPVEANRSSGAVGKLCAK